MTPQELVQESAPAIGAAGASFYFDSDTLARGKELGLDGFRFYFLGRGGVLGDVEPAVVESAFGYFNIGVVEAMWNSAKEIVEPREAAREYLDCASRYGRSKLSGVDGLDEFNDAAESLINGVETAGLALFAGIAAEPLPDDSPARAYRNICTLRELRGSVHLLAVVATGLSVAKAHAIRRPGDVESFGWAPSVEISDDERASLRAADKLTDQLLGPAFAKLSDDQANAFMSGVNATVDLTTTP